MLPAHMSNASVLSLNSVLLESPSVLTESYAQETPAVICQGIRNKDVRNFDLRVTACTNSVADLQIR